MGRQHPLAPRAAIAKDDSYEFVNIAAQDTKMATFSLPKNSTITGKARHHASPTQGKVRKFKVYRYDPDSGENPRYDTFDIDLDQCGPMVPVSYTHLTLPTKRIV